MKRTQVLELALATLLLTTCVNAWSQQGQTASAPGNPPGASAMAASGAVAPATGKKADRALRRKIYAAIATHKEISAGNLSVTAKDGAVTLNGSVTDASQIDRIAEIAKGVPGVASVTNKLTVKKPLGGM
jgi:hyperosmotically inducible protein